MKYQKTILENGLRIIAAPIEGTETFTVLVLVKTGPRNENKENNGISHFLEHMFFKGTKKRPTTIEIASALDQVGGHYNAFTSKEYTGFFAKVDAKHTNLALDWVSDIFLNSKLEAREIEREKGVIIEEINMYLDVPMQNVWHLWEELLYGDQPAGWMTLGRKENINGLKREEFIRYLESQYRTQNTIIVAAGNLNGVKNSASIKITAGSQKFRLHQDYGGQAGIRNYFKNIRTGKTKEKDRVIEKQTKPEALVNFKETDQTHLILGARAYDVFHKDRYALGLLSDILGGYMSSRLHIKIRERLGLAYYVRAITELYSDCGYLVANCGVAHKKVKECLSAILKEFKNLKEKKISAKELKRAKEHTIGSTLLNLESSDEVAGWLGAQEIMTQKILTPEQFFDKINQVQPQDILRVANDIFRPQKLNLALIGPFKDTQDFKNLLKI